MFVLKIAKILSKFVHFVSKPAMNIDGLSESTLEKFIDAGFMEAITYHFLGLGFVALSLKSAVKSKDSKKGVILDSGLITVNTYLVQAIVGLGITLVLSVSLFKELFHAAGLLLPLGFGQGTGQALNFGKVYESKSRFD